MSFLLAACVAVTILAALSPRAHGELPAEIRVLTYNIHHGEGTDGKIDLPRIAEVIKSVSPDIVALQEVDQGTRRAGGVDQPAELARLTGMKIVFGRNIDFDGGGYGTAVLTKLPVRSHESFKLKSFYPPTAENPEQRGVQALELGEKKGPRLWLLCTHLDYRQPDDERMWSAKMINRIIGDRGDELAILAGDLNAEPDSRVMREFAKEWEIAGTKTQTASGAKSLLTYPSAAPVKWIDYVLFRPVDRWKAVEVRVLEQPITSDHRPLLAVLRRVQ